MINERVIDRVNILVATQMAMERAVRELLSRISSPGDRRIQLLVDGTVKVDVGLPVTNIIRGDGRSKSIASASIIAKVTRDRLMVELDKIYPEYKFAEHKGYGTRAHIACLQRLGPSPIHRCSFQPVRGMMMLL